MKYNGKELIEMSPEKWDGNLRTMLVWDCVNDNTPLKARIVDWYKNGQGHVIWRDVSCKYWNYCAELPEEESKENTMMNKIEQLESENKRINMLLWSGFLSKTGFTMFKNKMDENTQIIKSLKESDGLNEECISFLTNKIHEAADVIRKLKDENEEFKEKIKLLNDEKETKEEKPNLKVGKWYYCYKNLPNAIRNCCVPTAIEGNFVFDGKFFVVPNASLIVKDNCVTYDLNTTIKYEASIFDKFEELPEKKGHYMTNRELAEWLARGNGVWAWCNHVSGIVGDSTSHKTTWEYSNVNADEPCTTNLENSIRIKGWGETEWHEPLIEE